MFLVLEAIDYEGYSFPKGFNTLKTAQDYIENQIQKDAYVDKFELWNFTNVEKPAVLLEMVRQRYGSKPRFLTRKEHEKKLKKLQAEYLKNNPNPRVGIICTTTSSRFETPFVESIEAQDGTKSKKK